MKNTIKVRSASKIGIVLLIATIIFTGTVLSLTGCPSEGSSGGGVVGGDKTVDESRISIPIPATGGNPGPGTLSTGQFTGQITWDPAVINNFAPDTAYKATIKLTAKPGWKLDVASDFFKVDGTSDASFNSSTSTVTAQFSKTAPGGTGSTLVTVKKFTPDITPTPGEAPKYITYLENQATGEVTWEPAIPTGGVFNDIGYSAKIKLTVNNGFTLTNLGADFFKDSFTNASTTLSNDIVTVVFPEPRAPYIITGENPDFSVTKPAGGALETNKSLKTVINSIRADARGSGVTIKFGKDSVLNIGANSVVIRNPDPEEEAGVPAWGEVTLTGKLTSIWADAETGVITIDGGVTVKISAEVIFNGEDPQTTGVYIGKVIAAGEEQSSPNHVTIARNGKIRRELREGIGVRNINGYLTVDGTIDVSTGRAIENQMDPESDIDAEEKTYPPVVTIRDGSVVKATTNITVQNTYDGAILIQGGRVEAESGTAVWNNRLGKITVDGGTVTSRSSRTNQGATIVLANNRGNAIGNTDTKLEIKKGTVENVTDNGNAVYNDSNGGIKISGGTVQATAAEGNGVLNLRLGAVEISGSAVVSATTGTAVWNDANGAVVIKGNSTVEAIAGKAVYSAYNTATNNNVGLITVSENALVTSKNVEKTEGTIHINGNNGTKFRLSITGGTIENTSIGNAVYNGDTGGRIDIFAGKVRTNQGVSVLNSGNGTVNVGVTVIDEETGESTTSGGTVTTQSGRGVYNVGNTGKVFIRAGKVEATQRNGIAVLSGKGQVTVSGDKTTGGQVISNNDISSEGTILLEDKGDTSLDSPNSYYRLTINGGQVLSTGDNGNAVYNAGIGRVYILSLSTADPPTFGYVSATGTNGNAVYNASNGVINITGAGYAAIEPDDPEDALEGFTEVVTSTGAAVFNASVGLVTISGGKVYATGGDGVAVVANMADNKTYVPSPNNNPPLVTVSGGLITSKNTKSNLGTIVLSNNGTASTPTTPSSDPVVPRVLISGGKVRNDARGIAVFNNSVDQVRVSGNAIVTSDNTKLIPGTEGTIVLSNVFPANVGVRLLVSGGTVDNTAIGGIAVLNLSNGVVQVAAGVVEAKGESSYAVYLANAGRLLMSQITNPPYPAVSTAAGGVIRALESGSYGVYNLSTAAGSSAVTNTNISVDGAVDINRGRVNVSTGTGVFNGSSGTVNISIPSDGSPASRTQITAGAGRAIQNNATTNTGVINITGGQVSTTEPDGIAIFITSFGGVNLNSAGSINDLQITSRNPASNKGTIVLAETLSFARPTLTITKGQVRLQGTNTGNLIYNASEGNIVFIEATGTNNIGVSKPSNGYIIYNNNEKATFNFTQVIDVPRITEFTNKSYNLKFVTPPVIIIRTQPPATRTVTAGTSTTLTVAASIFPDAQLTYQWQTSTTNTIDASFSNVSGATSASYATPTSLTTSSGSDGSGGTGGEHYYRCIITAPAQANAVNSPLKSDVTTLTVQ